MIAIAYCCDQTNEFKLQIFCYEDEAKDWLIQDTVVNGIVESIYDIVGQCYLRTKDEIVACFQDYSISQIIDAVAEYEILFEEYYEPR